MKFEYVDDEEDKVSRSEKQEQQKEPCPYCGKQFKSVAIHLPHCDRNPENKKEPGSESESESKIKKILKEHIDFLHEFSRTALRHRMTSRDKLEKFDALVTDLDRELHKSES